MIPPGIHFIYYSSCNREGREFSPVVGFFSTHPSQGTTGDCSGNGIKRKSGLSSCQKKRVQYLAANVYLHIVQTILSVISIWQEERYSDAVKRLEFDKQLGPYPLSQYGDWKRLSNYITKDIVERTEPIGGEISIACESEMVGKFSKSVMERALAEQLKNSKFSAPEEKSQKRGCYYTAIPRVVKHKGMCGKDLTSLNIDKTQLLETILMKDYGGDEDALLAELQFAFIAFLMGQSLEAFLQWKLLVSLLFGCTEAPLNTRSQLFTKFIKVIYHQLKYGFSKDQKNIGTMPEGVSALLDESWLSSDSFLHHLCKDFFSLVLEAPVVDGDLLSWTRRLKELLEDSLGWQFQQNSAVDGIYFEEDDEYAPVVEILD
ncbi:protein AAR2 [Sesamum alatum]|uniref:Protein AAR2 n=1 Tax=Sesamum alatum TaxID=300844 RepID=A0AAE1YB45_9LAMI|nr:protein AAR2 [Sesamum alatum]